MKNILLIAAIFVLASCASLRKGSSRLSSEDVVNNTQKTQPKIEIETTPEPVIKIREEAAESATPNIVEIGRAHV